MIGTEVAILEELIDYVYLLENVDAIFRNPGYANEINTSSDFVTAISDKFSILPKFLTYLHRRLLLTVASETNLMFFCHF